MHSIQLASFWRRLIAFIIDLFILNIVISIALQFIYGNEIAIWLQENMKAVQNQQAITPFRSPFVVPLFIGIAGIYVCVSWLKKQATIGQLILKIRVVDSKTLDTLSINRIAIRFFVLYGLTGLVLALPIIPQTISIIFLTLGHRSHQKQQGIHDLVAKSIVVADDQSHQVPPANRPESPSSSREF